MLPEIHGRTILIGVLLGLAFASPRGWSQSGSGQKNHADSPEVLRFVDREPIDITPDGRWIAISLVRPSRAAETGRTSGYYSKAGVPRNAFSAEIWVVDARTGETIRLSSEKETAWGAAWSPDGKTLVFFSDRDGRARLWFWDRQNETFHRGSSTQAIVRPSYLGFQTPRWSRDGRSLLVKMLPEGMTIEAANALVSQVAPFPTTGAYVVPDSILKAGQEDGWTNLHLADLAVVDFATGLIARVAPRAQTMGYEFSPNGRRVLYTELDWLPGPPGKPRTPVYTLWVVDRRAGWPHTEMAHRALRDYGLSASWDPIGRQIAYADSGGAIRVVGADILEVPLDRWTELARFSRPGLSFRTEYSPPLWSVDGQRLYLTAGDTLWEGTIKTGELRPVGTVPGKQLVGVVADIEHGLMWSVGDGRSVYVVTRDSISQLVGFYRISLADGRVEPRWQTERLVGHVFPYSMRLSNKGTVVLLTQDTARVPEVWLSDDTLHTGRVASNLRLEPAKKGRDSR